MFTTLITTPALALRLQLAAPGTGGASTDTGSPISLAPLDFDTTIGEVQFKGSLRVEPIGPSSIALVLTNFSLVNFTGSFQEVSLEFSGGFNPFPSSPISFDTHLDGSFTDAVVRNVGVTPNSASISFHPYYQPMGNPALQVDGGAIAPNIPFNPGLPSTTSFSGNSLFTTSGILADDYIVGGALMFSLGSFDSFSLPTSASITISPAPVPEPGTLILMGSGLAGMFFFRKKIRKNV